MYVWWPGIDADIERSVRLCLPCQEGQSSPPAAPLHPWKWPTRPWARLHLDFAGPMFGKMFLVTVDAHSKWIEAVCTPTTSSSVVIDELKTLFAKFGLPETIVTDNGTSFVSQEFEQFLKRNGIKHRTSAPYHPASNGMAERAVQIVKKGLKKVTVGSLSSRLAQILISYRMAPQSTTGVSPAELLMGRRLRTRLDLLKPNTADRVESKQFQQKAKHDSTAKARVFHVGQAVFMKNVNSSRRWLPGRIVQVTGPVSFLVQLDDGRQKRCHQDQLRSRVASIIPDSSTELQDLAPEFVDGPSPSSIAPTSTAETDQRTMQDPSVETAPETMSSPVVPSDSTIRSYPKRNRKPPERFEPGAQV